MRGRVLLLAVVMVAVLPMAVRGTSCGADLDFHVQNWLELTRSWHEGVAYPRWDASANYGAGEPRFVFYPLVTRVLGATLGAGLAAFWMVPAIYEQRWVELWRAVGPLMRVEDSFPFRTVKLMGSPAYPGELGDLMYHNQVLRTVSWIVGGLIVATLLAAWWSRRERSSVWLPLVLAAAAICGLQLRWSEPVWRIAPKLAYVQFAWRWMLALGMVAALLASLAMGRTAWRRRTTRIGPGVALAFACAMATLAGVAYWQPSDPGGSVRDQVAAPLL